MSDGATITLDAAFFSEILLLPNGTTRHVVPLERVERWIAQWKTERDELRAYAEKALAAARLLRPKVQLALFAFEKNAAIDWNELSEAYHETEWIDAEPSDTRHETRTWSCPASKYGCMHKVQCERNGWCAIAGSVERIEFCHQSGKKPTPRTDEAVARGMRDPDNWASLARELEARTEFQVNREGALYSLEDIRAVLAVHWLTEIQCGHDTKTDRSFCWCGSFICEPQPSVGAAVTRWVEHVMAQLPLHRDACEFVACTKQEGAK